MDMDRLLRVATDGELAKFLRTDRSLFAELLAPFARLWHTQT